MIEAIELRLIPTPSNWQDQVPGAIWKCWNANGSHDVSGRAPCYVVRLPGAGGYFHTNMESSDGGYWQVTGEPPKITVHPSINVGPEIWHGWIIDGVMNPPVDCHGRIGLPC